MKPSTRMPWGWLAALAVSLLAALGGVAYLLHELDAERTRAERLREELTASMHELAEARQQRREAEQAERSEQRRRVALEGQLEMLLEEFGLESIARDAPPYEEIAAQLDEALERGRPPGEVIAALETQAARHALLELERALATEPERVSGRDYLHAALLARYEAGATERAGQLLDEALEKQPGLVEAYHQRASLALEADNLDAAHRDTRLVLEFQSNHWRGWTLLGRIEAARGNADVAADAYQRARLYAPEDYRRVIDDVEQATRE